ncbi:MAG TPA: 2-oxoglutarate dehydrogenase E1 component [Cyclobacteriaceae bacterium]|nr:2-oxoglutarate dehydrogenase E1 component [Cyclobacteriaceae bacterium]
MDRFSYISNAEADYIEELYNRYRKDPASVDPGWQKFFEGFDFSMKFNPAMISSKGNGMAGTAGTVADEVGKETRVREMILAYRSRGHLKSDTNPIRPRRNHKVDLDLHDFGLTEADLEAEFEVGQRIGLGRASLRKIIDTLTKVYLGRIGFEYMYIRDNVIQDWFKKKAEQEFIHFSPSQEDKQQILKKLNEAVVFENFLHTKYIGQKRFSLEGGENTIPALDTIINYSAEFGVREVIIGMAHRGRLNVLANIIGKTYEEIFSEFEGNTDPDLTFGDGDVKYHQGYTSEMVTRTRKKLYLKLAPNPSHLEAVDPVVLGYTRGQIDDEYKGNENMALSILIHGDAAIAGQGILYETVQMTNLEGYRLGGTIHLVINNQVGFTTDYDDARSSIYCTDIAKIVDAPVLHIHGDDPEAVIFAARLAVEFRQTFKKDIFLDLLCYRRHGHNESDEPKFTQPKLYNLIAKHPNPREVYTKRLIARGDLDAELAHKMDSEFRSLLQDRLNLVKQKPLPYRPQKVEKEWEQMKKPGPEVFDESPGTSISQEDVDLIGEALSAVPRGFKLLKQTDKLLKDRKSNFFEKKMLTWADAELLAYGSLLTQNIIVRMSGQDVKRGTFSHRHAVILDAETNEPYYNICNISKKQEKFRIFNSPLSEYSVLGFEYGYAMATPNALVIWEAQFGDFVNGAQVMIDQFIVSAESKWQRMNGLVLLLPHGYEGQGPEHSNARPERFLQLAAENNIIIANITSPSNFFHLMRRQVTWNFRKPCIVMSPKSLLRHPGVISPIAEFTSGKFREVIDDDIPDKNNVQRVLLCTGKIFYELQSRRGAKERSGVALVRIEQLYPYPKKQLDRILAQYPKAQIAWVQEEPENMGALQFIQRMNNGKLGLVFSRKASASPATGYHKIHDSEQEEIITKSLAV